MRHPASDMLSESRRSVRGRRFQTNALETGNTMIDLVFFIKIFVSYNSFAVSFIHIRKNNE
jgi:hypothetical protein